MIVAALAAFVVAFGQDGYEEDELIGLAAPFDYVTIDGWNFEALSGDRDFAMFTQAHRRPAHIWTRVEYLSPRGGNRSQRTLVELDCRLWRVRTVQVSSFSRPNLLGESLNGAGDMVWINAGPGTFGEGYLDRYCPA